MFLVFMDGSTQPQNGGPEIPVMQEEEERILHLAMDSFESSQALQT